MINTMITNSSFGLNGVRAQTQRSVHNTSHQDLSYCITFSLVKYPVAIKIDTRAAIMSQFMGPEMYKDYER